MTKFTKITSAALFALFLTACDKPAEKKAEAPAPSTQTQEVAKAPEVKVEETKPAEAKPAETKAEEAKPAEVKTEVAKAESKPAEAPKALEGGAAEFQKLVDWGKAQEEIMNKAAAEMEQIAATKDAKKIQDGVTKMQSVFTDALKSLDGIEVKDTDVGTFKQKTKEVMELLQNLMVISSKAAAQPEKEAEFQEEAKGVAMKMMTLAPEMQKMEAELKQKFGIQ